MSSFSPRARRAHARMLSGLLSCALMLLPGDPARALGPAAVARTERDGFDRPPAGCALGISGPTLDPATALGSARDAAFAALAAERLRVTVSSEVSWIGGRVRERAHEESSGTLFGVWIAGLRRRPAGGIDAVACGAEVTRAHWPRQRNAPGRWPPRFHRAPHCALGVAGAGLRPGDQKRLATRDAREMLARAIEAHVTHRLSLDGGLRVELGHSVRVSAIATQLIEEADEELVRREWMDRRGRGPLRRPGLLYVELCLPEP